MNFPEAETEPDVIQTEANITSYTNALVKAFDYFVEHYFQLAVIELLKNKSKRDNALVHLIMNIRKDARIIRKRLETDIRNTKVDDGGLRLYTLTGKARAIANILVDRILNEITSDDDATSRLNPPGETNAYLKQQSTDLNNFDSNANSLPVRSVELNPTMLWASRESNSGPNPIPFIRKVYSSWLDDGFTITDLRKADPTLARRLKDWIDAKGLGGLEGLSIDMSTPRERRDRDELVAGQPGANRSTHLSREYERRRKADYRARKRGE